MKIVVCFFENRSLYLENRSLCFWKSEFVFLKIGVWFLKIGVCFYENQSMFITFAPVSAHLEYHEVSSKMADSQGIEDSCKEVRACQSCQDFHGDFQVNVTWFFASFFGVLD